MSDTAWGSDVPVSMPVPIDQDEVLIDFGTHVFTKTGMKINASHAVRAEIIANSYRPVDGGD